MASVRGVLPEAPNPALGDVNSREKEPIALPVPARTARSGFRPTTPKGLSLSQTRESSRSNLSSMDREEVLTPSIYADSSPPSGTQTPAGAHDSWRQYAPPAVPTIPSQYWKGGYDERPVYHGPADSAYAESSAAGSTMDLNRFSVGATTPGMERTDSSDQVIRDFYKRMGGTPDIGQRPQRSESSLEMNGDESPEAQMRVQHSPPPPATSLAAAHTSEYGMLKQNMEKLNTQMKVEPRYDPDTMLKQAGIRKIKQEKAMMTGFLITVNFILIFSTWYWPKYYYIYLPFIMITVALNCIMVLSLIVHLIWYRIFPEEKIMPEKPEAMVFLMPCYNETLEECTKSLDSLVDQVKIDQHPRCLVVVCDGKVRGPGMEKTTAAYLLEDIFVDYEERKIIRKAYMAWDHQHMDVEIQRGLYRGVPYFCIIKQQNQGKRDGLIMLRSFLHKYNLRHENPVTLFSKQYFGELATFLQKDAGIDRVDHLVGLDADTVFAEDCVYELLEQSRYKDTVGVCGYVAVDFKNHNWSPWSLYQSSEYTISQGLRRFHQSVVTNKVSCLPGCCQLLKICEYTCGDHVLVELFGYCPTPMDNIFKQIRATASEDRNHVCLMLANYGKARTRQALRAHAYTDVPHSWSVFLSQRRRWTLGATTNDLYLIAGRQVQWFERIIAFANVLTWSLNVFIIASFASFIVACLHVAWWIILAFASIMIVPFLWYVGLVLWLPKTWLAKVQYIMGLFVYTVGGPFLNITVLLYAVWNMDAFGWGKTRKVIAEDPAVLAAAEKLVEQQQIDEEAAVGMKNYPTVAGGQRNTLPPIPVTNGALKLTNTNGTNGTTNGALTPPPTRDLPPTPSAPVDPNEMLRLFAAAHHALEVIKKRQIPAEDQGAAARLSGELKDIVQKWMAMQESSKGKGKMEDTPSVPSVPEVEEGEASGLEKSPSGKRKRNVLKRKSV